MSAPVIEAEGLVKRYGRMAAVDGIDLTVGAGEVFGVLGPNGSGKTTTILMLLGLTEPSAGKVRVVGFDPARQPLEVMPMTRTKPSCAPGVNCITPATTTSTRRRMESPSTVTVRLPLAGTLPGWKVAVATPDVFVTRVTDAAAEPPAVLFTRPIPFEVSMTTLLFEAPAPVARSVTVTVTVMGALPARRWKTHGRGSRPRWAGAARWC